MDHIHRRHVFAGLSSLVFTSLPLSRTAASTARAANRRVFVETDYSLGCIFAKRVALVSPSSAAQPATSIDFWTARVSEIDMDNFAPDIGRVVVWDDVFS